MCGAVMVRPPVLPVLPLPALSGGVDVVAVALDCGGCGDPLPAVDAHAVIAHATANVLTAATRGREFIEATLRGSLSPVSSQRGVANLTGMELTYVDERGAARMVDVSAKDVTAREADLGSRAAVPPDRAACSYRRSRAHRRFCRDRRDHADG